VKVRADEEIPHDEKVKRLFAAIEALGEKANELSRQHELMAKTGDLRQSAAIAFAKMSKRLQR